jgi:type III restriction enzyme
MLGDIAKAKIVISNFHAFKRRETMDLSKVGRALLQGRGEAPQTIETEGQMLQRACGELMALKNVVVLNDEAHHCYREKAQSDEQSELKGEDKEEAKKNNEAARLWISGIEALKRKIGVRAVYDLSATPFFLRGSGYAEGTLFPCHPRHLCRARRDYFSATFLAGASPASSPPPCPLRTRCESS